MGLNFNYSRKIGMGSCVFGVVCTLLGILLLLDRWLLTIGNIFFILGLIFLLSPLKTIRFFVRREKILGSLTFFVGILLVGSGYTFTGFLVEFFGIWKLFSGFLPAVFVSLKSIPGMSFVLDLPGINWLVWHTRRLPV